MPKNKISNRAKNNKKGLNDEETMDIYESENIYNKTNISKNNKYITFKIKKTHMEFIFFFIFTILILFLIISGLFQKNHDEKIEQLGPIKYKNFINIAYAFDTNYHYITHVSMKSIMLSQNRDTFIIFHILVSSKIKDEEKKIIDKICQIHRNCEIKYFQMGERYKEINTKGYIQWSTAMFYRLRLPELLPNEKRILYLDCDTIIYKDLTKIYNYDIEGNYFTGMLEPRDLSYLGKNVKNYINTGVMLFNLEELRNGNVSKKLEEFLINYYDIKKWEILSTFHLFFSWTKLNIILNYFFQLMIQLILYAIKKMDIFLQNMFNGDFAMKNLLINILMNYKLKLIKMKY